MTSLTSPRRSCAAAGARRSAHRLERQVARFDKRLHRTIAELVEHPYLADLAFTFPGLLATFARRRQDPLVQRAKAAVVEGRALKEVAAIAGIAWWLRAVPPEAFMVDVPVLPDTPTLRLSIANHLPKPTAAAHWLRAVIAALQWQDEELAIWLARVFKLSRKRRRGPNLNLLYLYSWCSRHGAPIWRSLLRKPWSPDISLSSAREEAYALLDGVITYVCVNDVLGAPWFSPGEVDGLQFLPLTKFETILEEADAMHHCLRDHCHGLKFVKEEIVSIRRDGERIATMSVGFAGDRPHVDILQLSGMANATVERPVWIAARRWLDANNWLSIEGVGTQHVDDKATFSRWQALWRPFWLQKRRIPTWLPLRPDFSRLFSN